MGGITCRCRTASSSAGRTVDPLHTAPDFANGMIAEDTNPKEEPIADEVGRAEAWPGISREMVAATPR